MPELGLLPPGATAAVSITNSTGVKNWVKYRQEGKQHVPVVAVRGTKGTAQKARLGWRVRARGLGRNAQGQ